MTEENTPTFKKEDLITFKDEIAKLRNSIISKELSTFKIEREIEEDIPAENMQLLLNELNILKVKAEEIVSKMEDVEENGKHTEEEMFKVKLDLKKVNLDIEEAVKGKEMGLPLINKRAALANSRKGLREDKLNKKQYENLLLQAKKTLGIKSN